MKKSRFLLWPVIFLLAAALLSGCSHQSPPSRPTVVTGITVTYENGPISARRYYTTSAKMRAILNYLRWIDPYGTPEVDPDSVSGGSFSIVLSYSDGREKLYRQKADSYLLEEGYAWRKIDPDRAITLGKILGEMDSDA